MWCDEKGNNYTTQQVLEIVSLATGGGGDWEINHKRIGGIYQNGSIWFQRLS